MSRNTRLLLTAGLIVGAVAITIWVLSAHDFPAEAQRSLYSYLVLTHQAPAAVVEYEASAAHRFTVAMSRATYGDGTYFATVYTFDGENTTRQPPYPPSQIWCVWLWLSGRASPRLLLLALHEDMYVARWIAHEPADEGVAALIACPSPPYSAISSASTSYLKMRMR